MVTIIHYMKNQILKLRALEIIMLKYNKDIKINKINICQ